MLRSIEWIDDNLCHDRSSSMFHVSEIVSAWQMCISFIYAIPNMQSYEICSSGTQKAMIQEWDGLNYFFPEITKALRFIISRYYLMLQGD